MAATKTHTNGASFKLLACTAAMTVALGVSGAYAQTMPAPEDLLSVDADERGNIIINSIDDVGDAVIAIPGGGVAPDLNAPTDADVSNVCPDGSTSEECDSYILNIEGDNGSSTENAQVKQSGGNVEYNEQTTTNPDGSVTTSWSYSYEYSYEYAYEFAAEQSVASAFEAYSWCTQENTLLEESGLSELMRDVFITGADLGFAGENTVEICFLDELVISNVFAPEVTAVRFEKKEGDEVVRTVEMKQPDNYAPPEGTKSAFFEVRNEDTLEDNAYFFDYGRNIYDIVVTTPEGEQRTEAKLDVMEPLDDGEECEDKGELSAGAETENSTAIPAAADEGTEDEMDDEMAL